MSAPESLIPTAVDAPEFEQNLVSSLVEAFADRSIPINFEVPQTQPRGGKVSTGFRGRTLRGSAKGKPKDTIRHYRLVRAKDGTFSLVRIEDKGKTGGGKKSEGLEGAVRRAIKGTTTEAGAKLALVDPTILRIAEFVGRTLPAARQQLSETTIEKLVDVLVETQDPVASVSAEIDAVNAEARVRFMNNFATLGAEQVTTAAGSKARNRSQTASRWKAEGKIFSVPWQGTERFPAFQFKDGRPLPVIADILRALPEGISPWETAFWFVSTTGWLDGSSPRERLRESELVVQAARREREAVFG